MLECILVHHVDATIEKLGNVPFEAGIAENVKLQVRIELNQDIEVAVGARFAARHRAEQGSVPHAARAQRVLVPDKNIDCGLLVHGTLERKCGLAFRIKLAYQQALISYCWPAPPPADAGRAPSSSAAPPGHAYRSAWSRYRRG